MKIILLEDIAKLGKKYDVKDVKDGYARNSLFPKNLAILATEPELAKLDKLREEAEAKAEVKLGNIQEIASKLDGYQLIIKTKIGDQGQLFESINDKKIVEELKNSGYEIDKKQIILENPIKETGEFDIKIDFDMGIEANIKLVVEGEE